MRTPPDAERAAPARSGSSKIDRLAGTIGSLDSKPYKTPQELVFELEAARDQLDQFTRLGRWGLDLRARLWRTQQAFLYANAEVDVGPLAEEIAAYKRVCKALSGKGAAA